MYAFDTKMLERKWSNAIKVVESVKKESLSPEKKGALLHA